MLCNAISKQRWDIIIMFEIMLGIGKKAGPIGATKLSGIFTELTYSGSPPARYVHACVVLDDIFYVFGGNTAAGWNNELWAYSFATNTWTKKANAPGGGTVQSPAMHVFSGKLYVPADFGGADTTHHVYTPETNTWTTITSTANVSRSTRYGHVQNNDSWFGFSGTTVTPSRFGSWKIPEMIYTPLPITGAPSQRWDVPMLIKDTAIYVVGGNSNSGAFKDLWKYETLTQSWSFVGNTVDSVSVLTSFIADDELYHRQGNDFKVLDLNTGDMVKIATIPASVPIITSGAYYNGAYYIFGGELGGQRSSKFIRIT